MISQWFIELGCAIAAWFGDLIPPFEVPEWFTDPAGAIAQLAALIVGLGVWVPWPILVAVLVLTLGSWAATALVKLGRALLAHLPIVGGSGG